MSAHFEIPIWANGPDGSGNGGYSAGCIADACGELGAIEVNLRLPPPLATPLEVVTSQDGWSITDPGGAEIATARTTSLADLVVPHQVLAVTPARAERARAGFPYAADHPFPHCLCCGVSRSADLPSLNIHCGEVDGTALFAATWTPTADLAEAELSSFVTRAAAFSALDCPSAAPFADPDRPAVLARYEVRLDARPRVGEPCVLVAWEIARDGRKLTSASALVDWSDTDDPQVIGIARALWIEVRPA